MKHFALVITFLCAGLAGLALAAALTMPAAAVEAAPSGTLIVDTLLDENDGSCGDGDCSLRDAIATAASGDTVTFAVSGTINISALGELSISQDLTIDGGQAITVSGGHATRIFHVFTETLPTVNVVLDGLTVAHGRVITGDGCPIGGQHCGAGLLMVDNSLGASQISVTVKNSQFISNVAGLGQGNGAGIYNFYGSLTIDNSLFARNSAAYGGGALLNAAGNTVIVDSIFQDNEAPGDSAGAILSLFGQLSIDHSQIMSNSAAVGGGIYSIGSQITLTASSLVGNQAIAGAGAFYSYDDAILITDTLIANNLVIGQPPDADTENGGGLYLESITAGRPAIIVNSTIANNQTPDYGGGIYNVGQLNMVNSTMSGNAAGFGGGLLHRPYYPTMTLAVESSTIAVNRAVTEGGGISSNSSAGNVVLTNTIVVDNVVSGTLAPDDVALFNGTTDTFTSGGHNLIGAVGANIIAFNQPGDQTGVADALLGPLADNGGESLTHALLEGSPAIDAADNGSCPSEDQRGAYRPQDGDNDGSAVCDIGAVERIESCDPIVVQNNASSGFGSLRQAIADICFGGVINFDPSLSGQTIDVSAGVITGELAITKSLTISGNVPITVSGGDATRVFHVFTATRPTIDVVLEDLSIAHGFVVSGEVGAGIRVVNQSLDSARVTLALRNSRLIGHGSEGFDIAGAAVSSFRGLLLIEDSLVTNNVAAAGAGVANLGGNTIVSGSRFENNRSLDDCGGAIYSAFGSLAIRDTEIISNFASCGGGIASYQSSVVMTDIILVGNRSNHVGGAVYSYDNSLVISGAIISGNAVVGVPPPPLRFQSGGGLHLNSVGEDGQARIISSTIANNQADDRGGGIYNTGKLVIRNSTISGNSAGTGGGIQDNPYLLTMTMAIESSTIIANRVTSEGGGISSNSDTGNVILTNTIVADNVVSGTLAADDVALFDGTTDPFVSGGHNLIGAVGANITAFNQPGDQTGVTETLLAPLGDYGGSTLTHVPLPGSPAVDAADCTAGPSTDQRGFPRPQDSTCDIGAVEQRDLTLGVALTGAGPGLVSSTPGGIDCGTTCTEDFAEGTTVTLTATAEPDAMFAGWGGGCSGLIDCVIFMTATQQVTATFDTLPPETYLLTVTTTGTGEGTVTSVPAGIDCPPDCATDFDQGTVVTLTAMAETGSTFSGLSGACSGMADCVVTMTADQQVTATFDTWQIHLPYVVRP